jgi:hypothetical protein
VLVGLVEGESKAIAPQMPRFELAHRRMDKILPRSGDLAPRIDQLPLESQPERAGHAEDGLDRNRPSTQRQIDESS